MKVTRTLVSLVIGTRALKDIDMRNSNGSREQRLFRSAMLAGSFERWQRQHLRFPLVVPDAFAPVIPVSVDRAKSIVRAAPPSSARTFAGRCIQHDLMKCNHPAYQDFEGVLKAGNVSVRRRSVRDARPAALPADARALAPVPLDLAELDDENVDSEAEIKFDPETLVTKVIVRSYFDDLTRAMAQHIVDAADPPNWQRSAQEFFKTTLPGAWRVASSKFSPHPDFVLKDGVDPAVFDERRESARLALLGDSTYQLWEHVDWDLSPQMSGGVINILEIENREQDDPKTFATDVLERIVDHTDENRRDEARRKANRVRAKHSKLLGPAKPGAGALPDAGARTARPKAAPAAGAPAKTPSRHFGYRLIRCKQSKILSAWEYGGLDLDDGHYQALWAANDGGGVGTLFIEAAKSIHYSRRADVIPGTANLLNLLAPSVTTMLMTQLAFSRIVAHLKNPAGGAPAAALAPSGYTASQLR